MKARITIDHEASSSAAEGTYEIRDGIRNGLPAKIRIRPIGMVIDSPDAWKLVAVGLADPEDDECKARFTPQQVAEAKEKGHPRFMANLAAAIQQAKDDAMAAESEAEEE